MTVKTQKLIFDKEQQRKDNSRKSGKTSREHKRNQSKSSASHSWYEIQRLASVD